MEYHVTENGIVANFPYGELRISGDEKQGFRPYQLLVSAVAGCSCGVLKTVLQKMRIPFTDLKVAVQIERNEKEANRIEKIHLHFVIAADPGLKEKIEKALAIAWKNCSMIQSVKDSIEIHESLELIS